MIACIYRVFIQNVETPKIVDNLRDVQTQSSASLCAVIAKGCCR